jgi:hypothetical protein
MEKDDSVDEIKQALIQFVTQKEDEAFKQQMEFLIDAFFQKEVLNCPPEKAKERFGTVEQIISEFRYYLEGQGHKL